MTTTVPMSPVPAAAAGADGSLDAALAGLRDVRLPEPVSWWPLAPGWWALAAVLVVTLGVSLVLLARRRRSTRHAALAELERLRREEADAPPDAALATTLGVLLRRVLIASDEGGAERVGTLHGEAWSARLTDGPDGLPAPLARWIAAAPYARADDLDRAAPDAAALFDASERWIRKHA